MNKDSFFQIKYSFIIIFSLVVIFSSWFLIRTFNQFSLIFILLLLGILIIFCHFKITIGQGFLETKYGPLGLFRKRMLLEDIKSIQEVKRHRYYGWGIRFMPKGKFYNISILKTIEIITKDDKRHYLMVDKSREFINTLEKSKGDIER